MVGLLKKVSMSSQMDLRQFSSEGVTIGKRYFDIVQFSIYRFKFF